MWKFHENPLIFTPPNDFFFSLCTPSPLLPPSWAPLYIRTPLIFLLKWCYRPSRIQKEINFWAIFRPFGTDGPLIVRHVLFHNDNYTITLTSLNHLIPGLGMLNMKLYFLYFQSCFKITKKKSKLLGIINPLLKAAACWRAYPNKDNYSLRYFLYTTFLRHICFISEEFFVHPTITQLFYRISILVFNLYMDIKMCIST